MNQKASMTYPERCLWKIGAYQFFGYLAVLEFVLQSNIKKSDLVLDAGCGDGWLLFSMTIQGIGIDINRDNIRKATRNQRNFRSRNLSFIVSDIHIHHIHIIREAFDVIVCSDVLEHVKNAGDAISEMASSLRKGGRLFITTSNSFNPLMFLDGILPRQVSNKIARAIGEFWYPRTRRYNPWALRQKLNECNLEVEKLLMFAAPPFAPLYRNKIQVPTLLLIVSKFLFYFWTCSIS